MIQFQKAVKSAAKLRLAFTGPSGSGKTYSALRVATGMGKKIALIDTENHSASLYADNFVFDTISLNPPYTVDKYIDAIKAAVDAKYEVLVIDSISHAWAGEGGLLEKKGAMDVRGGNSYTNWAPVTKEHEQFKALLLNCNIHLIVTMRSKQDYVIEVSDKGKSAPRKVGLAPIQREGMEYEFTIVLDMAMDHNASVSKTRISKYDGKVFQPSQETGADLLRWLNEGAEPVKPVEVPEPTPIPTKAWPKPFEPEPIATKVPEAIAETHEEAVDETEPDEVEDIIMMLKKINGGDPGAMNEHLKDLTRYTNKTTGKENCVQVADLERIQRTNPKWIYTIHRKVLDAYNKMKELNQADFGV